MRGTCAGKLKFDIRDGKLRDLSFVAGCDGNLKAIARLTDGMDAAAVAEMLRGNTCGRRKTSCADQLARAIDSVLGTNTP
jgi:uncharacterized protein (TIGR03905 family)